MLIVFFGSGSRFEPLTQLQHRAAEPHIRSPLRAADTKIPHTRGHRAREDGTNLYGGILQPGRYAAPPPRPDEEFPRGCYDVVRIAPALCGLEHGAVRNLALGYIAPDRNQQLAGERNDRDPADPPAFIANAGVEPTAQG